MSTLTKRESIEATNLQMHAVRTVYPDAQCVKVAGTCAIMDGGTSLSPFCPSEQSAWRFAYLNVRGD